MRDEIEARMAGLIPAFNDYVGENTGVRLDKSASERLANLADRFVEARDVQRAQVLEAARARVRQAVVTGDDNDCGCFDNAPREGGRPPYAEEGDGPVTVRTFPADVDEKELQWHRDGEDRLVSPLHETDWLLQLDDELPRAMEPGRPTLIPRGVWHRLHRGTGDLSVAVERLDTA